MKSAWIIQSQLVLITFFLLYLYSSYKVSCTSMIYLYICELTEIAVTLTASTVEWVNRYHRAAPISVVTRWWEGPDSTVDMFSIAFAAIWWTVVSSWKTNINVFLNHVYQLWHRDQLTTLGLDEVMYNLSM